MTEPSPLQIIPVQSPADYREFIGLPYRLYQNDPRWVAPLMKEQRERLLPRHSPFYLHGDVKLFLAKRNGKTVGRISAQINHEYEKFHGERMGHFGFFECENDPQAAQALLNAAEEFLSFHQAATAQGPFSFSINEECGLLIDGFEHPPMIQMPYNPPFYATLIENSGYSKAKDLLAWKYDPQNIPEEISRMANELTDREDISIRGPDMADFESELKTIIEIFNSAWSDNWGFVPLTEAEVTKAAKDLKTFIDPQGIVFGMVNGKPAAIGLGVPNLYELIRGLNGRLFPFGLVRLIWRIKRKKYRSGRLMLMGVKKNYRGGDLGALSFLIFKEGLLRFKNLKMDYAEFSWTLEDNRAINTIIELFGGKPYKTYRIYQKEL